MTTLDDGDQAFADLLDDLLDQVLDGEEPDLDAAAARHPAVAERVHEALALASGLAGRKVSARPTLQGYEVVRELGRGGMGTVYLARQAALARDVAIKVLPHSFGLSAASRQRFLEEARALARLKHEHIVDIHRVVDDGELLAFEMEYVDGPSLHSVLAHLRERRERTGERPTLDDVAAFLGVPVARLGVRNLTQFFVELARKVASALAAVHAAGLVHRDVKPANLLLRQNGDPVVVDFGLVRLRGLEATHAGRFAGTPVYSSPEQLRGDPIVGPAADVYSLGVTLYECLTMVTPFAGRTTTDLLQRIEQGRFKPLRRLAPDAPRDLETIVGHAMEVDAQRRYADGGALAADLQRLLELRPIEASPASAVRRLEKFSRRNRKPLLGALVGAVAVALLLLPILHEVEARHRAGVAAREHLQRAREQLVGVDAGNVEWRHAVLGSPTLAHLRDQPVRAPALADARTEYAAALALDADAADARVEHDVVRLASWLRELSGRDPDQIDASLGSPEFAAMTETLGPMTVRFARALAGAQLRQPDAADVEAADDADRVSFGLLAYLFGDFRRCEQAWQAERSRVTNHPLVDAGLGRLLLADGMPEAAYPRLLQARAQFPGSAALALELADAALQLGHLQLARRWLDAAGDDATPTRRRLQLDLRAATEAGDELLDDYVALANDDWNDPTARHRLAQFALRRGDLAEAERLLDGLIAGWPEAARFRLDRARVALQRRDLPSYARQVLAVLELDFGRRLSRGSAADLLEVLRLGGLEGLYLDGVAANDGASSGRLLFGGELPIRAFAPPALTRDFEAMALFLHDVRRTVLAVRGDTRRMDDTTSALALALPIALTRSPAAAGLSWRTRAVLAALPIVGPDVYDAIAPRVRPLLAELGFAGWRRVDLPSVPRPEDLSFEAIFGSAMRRVDDATGDGVGELLIACSTPEPERGRARVLLVDGAYDDVLATLHNDSEHHLFGFSLAVIGDVDGDGARDWLIGAPGTPRADGGRADVYSSRTRRLLRRLTAPSHGFGAAVAALDDCDGDGVRDFAVASVPLLLNAAAHGAVRVYSGGTFEPIAEHRNDEHGVWFGAQLADVGDADGDGVGDLAVGGNYGGARGLVRLYSGATGEVLHTWTDRVTTSGFGAFVGPAGDLDGDERADVIVSAVADDGAALDKVFVYSGRTGEPLLGLLGERPGDMFGRCVVPFGRVDGAPVFAIGAPRGGEMTWGTVELRDHYGACLTRLAGPHIRGGFGFEVLVADDLDGDGLGDLVVGALGLTLPTEPAGRYGLVFRASSRQLLEGN